MSLDDEFAEEVREMCRQHWRDVFDMTDARVHIAFEPIYLHITQDDGQEISLDGLLVERLEALHLDYFGKRSGSQCVVTIDTPVDPDERKFAIVFKGFIDPAEDDFENLC